VIISKNAYDDLLNRARVNSLAVSDVQRILQLHKDNDPFRKCSFLAAVIQPDLRIVTYNSVDPNYYTITERGLPTGSADVAPVISGAAFTPCISESMDQECVRLRITNVINSVVPPDSFGLFAVEFIKLLNIGLLCPLLPSEVRVLMDRPSQVAQQVAISSQPLTWDYARYDSFQKRESYPKIAAPRNITTLPKRTKFLYSEYVLAVSAVVKSFRWYAFSKSPVELENSVFESLKGSYPIVESDFSAFDGRHSQFFVTFEMLLLQHSFGDQVLIEQIQQHLYGVRSFTKFGVEYNSGTSRPSGSPDTSLFNTLDNALVSYICFRQLGFPAGESFDLLGIYGGDDALVRVCPTMLGEVCRDLGLDVKIKVISEADYPTFLGRILVENTVSGVTLPDPGRILPKIHITTDLTVACHVSFARKIYALHMSNPGVEWIDLFYDKVQKFLPRFRVRTIDFPWLNRDKPFSVCTTSLDVQRLVFTKFTCILWNDFVSWLDTIVSLEWLPLEERLSRPDDKLIGYHSELATNIN
jgi:hypothetical protein